MLSTYKAQIINFDVQKANSRGIIIPHGLSADWGMVQIREIEAIASLDAMLALSLCYPKELGFRVLSVEPADSIGGLRLEDVFSSTKLSI